MNKIIYNKHKGFTLIEILLIITLLGLLSAIVLSAINPIGQLGRARDLQRQQDLSQLEQALEKYFIDNGRQYPASIPLGRYVEICSDTLTSGCSNLSFLVPQYLSSIPKDPTGVNYKIGINPDNSNISLWSEAAEQAELAVNKFFVLAAAAKDPAFDTGIPVGFNNPVNTLALQSDGKILVGGNFTSYQGVGANYIIRLNSDGSRDTSFNVGTGFNSTVNTLTLQSDGKILVGGWFTSYQGVGANNIIRLNSDGSRDNSFNIGSGFSGSVSQIIVQSDGKVLVGGGFTSYQGVGANYIIRLNSDGSRDTSFNIGTGFNSWVYSLSLQSDGKILVGGNFTIYQDQPAGYLIRVGN
ncbi:MAG: hypothetical protein RLZZ223_610 [Candidatus Parcubacteria bacterium]